MIDDVSQPTAANGQRVSPPRRPRMLIVFLIAGVIGAVAGWLSHAAGSNLPAAVLTGGGAFAGAVGLLLTIVRHVEVG